MKRKTSETPTKIWSFGALRPTENEPLLLDQLFEANKYYNQLIEIERKRRDDFRTARSTVVPELGALEVEYQRLDALYEAGVVALPKPPLVDGKRPKKAVLTPELLALKEQRKVVSASMKALRAQFAGDSDAKAQLAHINEAAQLAVKAARAATPLYWGTYLLIENQVEAARKSKLDPRFRGYRGEGRVGVQLQGGLTIPELFSGADTRLQFVKRVTNYAVVRPKSMWVVRIRVGSEGRAPIWATLPIVTHRELPPDASIKWAWIKVRNTAGRRRYDLQIAMESESFSEMVSGSGTCAINFGWRANADGSKRVAYLVDDASTEREMAITGAIESTLDFCDSLRSARDLHFEEAKRAVMAHMALHGGPEWLVEETRHIAQWRNPKHLVKVTHKLTEESGKPSDSVRAWRLERLAAKPKKDLFAPYPEIQAWYGKRGLPALAFYLELWRLKNRHLWQWESDAREKAVGRRNDTFRNWARQIANKYSVIHIEDFDLREMAKTPEVDEEQRPKHFRSSRAIAAPGEFRRMLIEVGRHKIVVSEAKHNTVKCHECGAMNERSLVHTMTCVGCNETYDQDANNCRNQLGGKLATAAE